jgi:beta-lactamase regulating signal transducer with metallopeptidase domain
VTPLLDALLRASIQGALFAGAVWAVCRLFPGLPAGLRCALWWLACLKILVSFAWISPVELPLLPAPEPVPVTVFNFQLPETPSPLEQAPRLSWPLALAAIWLIGLLAQVGGIFRQLAHARRIVRRAGPVGEPWIAERFAELRRALGLGERAELRISSEVEAPQVLGLLRPVVLLPEARPLSPPDVSMALCHELVHVRRADLWWGWVPALAQRLFWFHPLVRLSAREYELAREAACDAEVLRVLDPEPRAYGRLLLRLGVAPRASRLAAAGAAPSVQTLKRRLQMLEQSSENRRFPLGWVSLIVLVALVALVPFRMVAQEAPAAPEAAEAGEPAPAVEPVPAPEAVPAVAGLPAPEAVPAVEAAPAPEAVPALAPGRPAPAALPVVAPAPRAALPAPAPAPVARVSQVAPAPPAPPVPPAPPAPPAPPKSLSWEKGESYVLMLGKSRSMMSGSMDDVRRAKDLQKGDEPLLYFRRNGKAYVVRDAALLKQAEEIFRPQAEMGARQGELGAQQGRLGAQQGALGAKQGELGAKQGELGSRQARRGEDDEALAAEMETLAGEMEELGKEMEALGRDMEKLGRQQEELGREQERLGREAQKNLRALVDGAIRSGAAQEVER